MKIEYDTNTFGNTQRSLKLLRDTLAERCKSMIAVIEIPTNDLCCGYLVVDRDNRVAIFTGDGFRFDGHGEGGAGYKTAQKLMSIWGLFPMVWEPVPIWDIITSQRGDEDEAVKDTFRKITEEIDDSCYIRPIDRRPGYGD